MKYIALLAVLCLPAYSQTWVKVATESPTTTISLPAGATYRLGAGTCWSANTSVTKAQTLNVYWPTGPFPFADPCPGVTKDFYVMQTSSAQSVTVTANGKQSTVTVPALKPSGTYPFTCTLSTYSDGTPATITGCVVTKK